MPPITTSTEYRARLMSGSAAFGGASAVRCDPFRPSGGGLASGPRLGCSIACSGLLGAPIA